MMEAGLPGHLDYDYLLDVLMRLIRVPTEVPLGPATLMAPDHPKLVHYVQKVIRPELTAIGAYEQVEAPLNQLIVQMGNGTSGRSLLVMVYTPTQHNNLMRDPFVPRVGLGLVHGHLEPCVFGQGVSQNKAHMAAMLTLLRALAASRHQLSGRLYFAVNNEGRSSHDCSTAILQALPEKPELGLILIGTGLDISAGNRGRVDICVQVRGRAAHSSTPERGLNAIAGAQAVLNRVGRLQLGGAHPLLGGRHIVPYQVTYWPVAPHTLPELASIRFDRRLLPDDDLDEAVAQVRAAIGDLSPFEVSVERGVHMLPALLPAGSPAVTNLCAANVAVRGIRPRVYYGQGSFDAGGPCAAGVPTVMWGASGGDDLLGDDFVPLAALQQEVRVLARLVSDYLG